MSTRWSLWLSRQTHEVLPYVKLGLPLVAVPLVGMALGFWLRSKLHRCHIERGGIRIEEA